MKNLYIFSILLFVITFFSCQNENETIISNPLESLTTATPLYSLLSRVTQSPTSYDNIIDDSSCFSIKFPLNVVVNSQSVYLASASDIPQVNAIFNQSSYDVDTVICVYPVTIVYKNFQEIQVQNYQQFYDLKENCEIDEAFDEINCIDFNYPIPINLYETNLQVSSFFDLKSDKEFYNFLESLTPNQVYSLVYPISLHKTNGQTIVANSSKELTNAIEVSISECNNTSSSLTLSNVIINGNWRVSYFLHETENQTSDYNGYGFVFYNNGSVIATKNSVSTSGTWNTYSSYGVLKMNIDFDNFKLDELKKDWKVIEYNANTFRLSYQENSNNETNYLYFDKN